MMIGHHLIKAWSATQATISLSSGEAEFYGVVRAAGIALGQRSILEDLALRIPCRVWTDSSAVFKIDLQGIFWMDFYTKLSLKIITKSLEPSKLSKKAKN